MAIPCDACGEPVHEQVVVCPHCAGPTGVPIDPIAKATIETLPALEPPPPDEDVQAAQILSTSTGPNPIVSGLARLLASDGDGDSEPDSEPLPRAIARRRRRDD